MGDVYVARDSKLGRDVAIKVLPDSLAGDPARLARLEREARVLASLNHPHIAHVYGLEHADGIPALVMELVDGPTLADHIALKPISLREALRIARQIAEALEAAHEQGIVHRDLKPSNIKLTARGEVKVLDFGLATMREEDSARPADLTTQDLSSPNAIVGTPAYMAPEQAKGEPATHAVDVWAFGCVLFALLSGKPPFGGTTTTEILAEVLKSEPDWGRLPADTPPAIRRTLRRCLAKDIRARFHHIADVRLALEDAEEMPAPVPVHRSSWRERAAWIVATVGIAAAAFFFAQRSAVVPAERRFDIVTPPEADAGGIALSSDGTSIAYTALAKGVPYLYVRSLENGSRAPPGGHARSGVAVLVSSWRRTRLLCGEPAEAGQSRHRCDADAGDGNPEPGGWFLERRRHHRLCAQHPRPPSASSGCRRRGGAGPARGTLTTISGRRTALLVPRPGQVASARARWIPAM